MEVSAVGESQGQGKWCSNCDSTLHYGLYCPEPRRPAKTNAPAQRAAMSSAISGAGGDQRGFMKKTPVITRYPIPTGYGHHPPSGHPEASTAPPPQPVGGNFWSEGYSQPTQTPYQATLPPISTPPLYTPHPVTRGMQGMQGMQGLHGLQGMLPFAAGHRLPPHHPAPVFVDPAPTQQSPPANRTPQSFQRHATPQKAAQHKKRPADKNGPAPPAASITSGPRPSSLPPRPQGLPSRPPAPVSQQNKSIGRQGSKQHATVAPKGLLRGQAAHTSSLAGAANIDQAQGQQDQLSAQFSHGIHTEKNRAPVSYHAQQYASPPQQHGQPNQNWSGRLVYPPQPDEGSHAHKAVLPPTPVGVPSGFPSTPPSRPSCTPRGPLTYQAHHQPGFDPPTHPQTNRKPYGGGNQGMTEYPDQATSIAPYSALTQHSSFPQLPRPPQSPNGLAVPVPPPVLPSLPPHPSLSYGRGILGDHPPPAIFLQQQTKQGPLSHTSNHLPLPHGLNLHKRPKDSRNGNRKDRNEDKQNHEETTHSPENIEGRTNKWDKKKRKFMDMATTGDANNEKVAKPRLEPPTLNNVIVSGTNGNKPDADKDTEIQTTVDAEQRTKIPAKLADKQSVQEDSPHAIEDGELLPTGTPGDKNIRRSTWDQDTVFREAAPTHPADETGRPLAPGWNEDVILPRRWDARCIQSVYVTEDNVDQFVRPVRDTDRWEGLKMDPAFIERGCFPDGTAVVHLTSRINDSVQDEPDELDPHNKPPLREAVARYKEKSQKASRTGDKNGSPRQSRSRSPSRDDNRTSDTKRRSPSRIPHLPRPGSLSLPPKPQFSDMNPFRDRHHHNQEHRKSLQLQRRDKRNSRSRSPLRDGRHDHDQRNDRDYDRGDRDGRGCYRDNRRDPAFNDNNSENRDPNGRAHVLFEQFHKKRPPFRTQDSHSSSSDRDQDSVQPLDSRPSSRQGSVGRPASCSSDHWDNSAGDEHGRPSSRASAATSGSDLADWEKELLGDPADETDEESKREREEDERKSKRKRPGDNVNPIYRRRW